MEPITINVNVTLSLSEKAESYYESLKKKYGRNTFAA